MTTPPTAMPDVIWARHEMIYAGHGDYIENYDWFTCERAESVKYHADHIHQAALAEIERYKSLYEFTTKEKAEVMIGREDYRKEIAELKALADGMEKAFKDGETILPLLIGDLIYMANRMNEGARFKEMTASAQGILDRMDKALTTYQAYKEKMDGK